MVLKPIVEAVWGLECDLHLVPHCIGTFVGACPPFTVLTLGPDRYDVCRCCELHLRSNISNKSTPIADEPKAGK